MAADKQIQVTNQRLYEQKTGRFVEGGRLQGALYKGLTVLHDVPSAQSDFNFAYFHAKRTQKPRGPGG